MATAGAATAETANVPLRASDTPQSIEPPPGRTTEVRSTTTALDQSNSEADLRLTQQIRREIVERDGLSISAQNVTVVSRDGQVVLQGTVDSEQERQAIHEIATRAAQARNVENRIEIKSSAPRRE